jgi:hypothetical protein
MLSSLTQDFVLKSAQIECSEAWSAFSYTLLGDIQQFLQGQTQSARQLEARSNRWNAPATLNHTNRLASKAASFRQRVMAEALLKAQLLDTGNQLSDDPSDLIIFHIDEGTNVS